MTKTLNNKLNPLSWNVPIADQQGLPTLEFMRKWAQQQRTNASIPDLTSIGALSAALDLFTKVQGSIIYRGASQWTFLGPGTSGYFLKTQGAAANPIWAASGSLTVTDSTHTVTGTTTITLAGAVVSGATPNATVTISDATIGVSDITTNNVSTAAHGFAPKAPNDANKFLDGTGGYSVPPGTGVGGGGSPVWTAEWILTGSFTHSFAVAGNLFTPTQNVTLYSASAVMTTVTSGTYKLGVAPYNTGTNQITSAPTYSGVYTEASGLSGTFVTGNFSGGFNMTAGSTYVIFVVRTDSTTTVSTTLTSCLQQYGSSTNLRGIAFQVSSAANQSVHLASTGPLTSDTWTTEGGYYGIHLVLAIQ